MDRRQFLRLVPGVAALSLPGLSSAAGATPPVVRPRLGASASSADGSVRLRLIAKRQGNYADPATYDPDIRSPKSVHIHPDGTRYYVNSLEGGKTVCYEMATHRKLAVIRHEFREGATDALWAPPSGLYPWRHYRSGRGTFWGKPVESAFTHGGRYLWVPYYRRSFDINAQDPSALAVIDTGENRIIRMMETGPLPKMIAASPDGRTVAVSHWGNNTVGLIDVASEDPAQWRHRSVATVDYELRLNFPLSRAVDRDNRSGYALRGTVFTPDSRHLLVGCMGGGGGIAVIDVASGRYLGRVLGMLGNLRHIVISGPWLYLSANRAGVVQRMPLAKFMDAALSMKGGRGYAGGWQSCSVGAGARTISLTADGRYLFAACNTVSRLVVVDTRAWRVVASIPADSFPVGLDVSADGTRALVTSQGRNSAGGNAVCIYEVSYG